MLLHSLSYIELLSLNVQQVIFTNESNIDRWKNKRQAAVDSKLDVSTVLSSAWRFPFRWSAFSYLKHHVSTQEHCFNKIVASARSQPLTSTQNNQTKTPKNMLLQPVNPTLSTSTQNKQTKSPKKRLLQPVNFGHFLH